MLARPASSARVRTPGGPASRIRSTRGPTVRRMNLHEKLSAAFAVAMLGVAALAPGAHAATETHTFTRTGGEQALVVPDGVASVHAVVVGADGGAADSATGGDAFLITGDIAVQAGEVLYVEVGSPGANAS